MANAQLNLRANRSPLSNLDVVEPDSRITLRFDDGQAAATTATLTMDQHPVCRATRAEVYAVFARVIGAPARDWAEAANTVGVQLTLPPNINTIEQNLAKATFLIALWLEPSVIASHPAPLTHELIDTIIVDYSGVPGRQRHIYFPQQNLPAQTVERLYRLHLLCRIQITIGGGVTDRYFVPLVTPGVGAHVFDPAHTNGGESYRAWQDVRRNMGRCIQRTFRSNT